MASLRMIDQPLGAFLESPVMIVVATRGAEMVPAITRGLGAVRHPEGGVIDVFASASQWPQALGHLAPGDAVAVTFCRPTDYQTYQIKGELQAFSPADTGDADRAGAYLREVTGVLRGLGVEPRQIACWLTLDGLVRLTIQPLEVFLQTPGPNAGARLEAVR